MPRVQEVAGTYDVMMCRGSCEGEAAQVLARGRMVIESQPYSVEDMPSPARDYFKKYPDRLLNVDAEGAPNLCFAMRKMAPGTLAASGRVAVTRWTRGSGDTLLVRLYHSPDAGYDARFSLRAGMIAGTGESWGPWDESENSPPDVIAGRRIGPVDRGLCIRAAEERWAELQR